MTVSLLHKKSRHVYLRTEKVRMLIRYNMKKMKWSGVMAPKGSTMVCTCLLSTEWTNFWGMNKNKNKHCCTTSSKSKSSISSLSFRYLPCLMINKELVNTHLSTFEHSNLTRNDKNNSTWPHLKTESLTLALIQHHGCFEKQWTCLVFNEALGPRNIKVNGGQFRRIEMIKITQLDHISRLKVWPWHWSSIMVALRNNGHA